MPIRLPEFSCVDLRSFVACGRIEEENDQSTWPKEDEVEVIEATYESAGNTILARLTINRQDDPLGLHIHFDAFRESELTRFSDTPESIEAILTRLAAFNQCEMYIRSDVDFRVSMTEVPEEGIISLLTGIGVGPPESDVSLIGSTFRISADSRLVWKLSEEDADDLLVTLESRRTHTFSDLTFESILDTANAAYQLYVLEKPLKNEVANG